MSRLETVKNIAEYFQISSEITSTDYKLENNTILPTIGVEIEVNWRTVIPNYNYWFKDEKFSQFSREKKKEYNKLCNQLEKDLLPIYEETRALGIPKGRDKFYEFAFEPVNHYNTASKEINTLINANLIKEDWDNPLHITIGNISKNVDFGLATCAIELLGGTTYKRLQTAFRNKGSHGWHCKGKNGILEKEDYELSDSANYGSEIRTLSARNKSQIETTLKNTQLLMWAIQSNKENKNERVIDYWNDIKEIVQTEILRPYKLNNWWKEPHEERTSWETFGKLIESEDTTLTKAKLNSYINHIEIEALKLIYKQ